LDIEWEMYHSPTPISNRNLLGANFFLER
jgi:hypothetical protein